MNFSNSDKQAIINEQARILTKVTLLSTGDVLTEDTSVANWKYEDFRYVPNQGFIGQFVERLMDVTLKGIEANSNLVDQEINVQIGVYNNNTHATTYYNIGNFIVTKVGDVDTSGNITVEAADYTKKFNIAYDYNESNFPILAGHLANDICDYVGVELADYDNVVYYIHSDEIPLAIGNYYIVNNNTTYKFTTTHILNKFDVLLINLSTNTITQKIVDPVTCEITRTTLSTTSTTGTELVGVATKYGDFTNNDFVIDGWPYTSYDMARQALCDIGKLAYGWVRVGEDNKVHIDFAQTAESAVNQYDCITTDDYYNLTTEPKYIGPINRISLGLSDITGEEVYKDAPGTWTEINELEINDNAFTGTDRQRRTALNGCDKLFGLKYMPLNINTTGHPWLRGDELIKVQKLDNEYVYTYPFDRTLNYSGFIKSDITSTGKNKVQAEYQVKSDVMSIARKAEINVDKANGQIELLTNEVYPNGTESESAIQMNNETITIRVNGIDTSVKDLNKEFTQFNETYEERTKNSYTLWFTESGIEGDVSRLQEAMTTNSEDLITIKKYIRQENGKIILGEEGSQMKVIISNDRISFYTGDAESAYISQDKLYITDSTILNKLQVGNWETKEDSNHNLNTRWIG